MNDEQLHNDNSCYLISYGADNWHDSYHHDYQYMIEQTLSFADDIPEYLGDWIRSIDMNKPPVFPTDLINPSNKFISFNYTNTLEHIYGIPHNRIFYIHGFALDGNNLIAGHHDESLFEEPPQPVFASPEEEALYYEGYDEDVRITEANEIIRRYYGATYKDTTSIANANLRYFEALSDVDEVYIIGHSLSDIDFEYFELIKSHVAAGSEWHISYYTDDDYDNACDFVEDLGLTNYHLFKT